MAPPAENEGRGGKIFVSYRRADSAGHAGRLYDHLATRYGAERIFMDVDNIAPGVDFAATILEALSGCAVLLVVIGPEWAGPKADGSRRIDEEDDFVRIEVATGLSAGIRVVPLLVHGAVIPVPGDLPEPIRALVARNAVEVRDSRWHADVESLLRTLDPLVGAQTSAAAAGAPPPAAPPVAVERSRRTPPLRKIVTVLFVDITGWDRLAASTDPEAMQTVLDRYFARVAQIVLRHGGRVEQYVGDGAMAIFGVPEAHEDDAVRAVRAAVEARAAIGERADDGDGESSAALKVRAGINTGEVVVGDPTARQPFSVGDTVNVAAQLVQIAQPDEILVGTASRALLGDFADLHEVPPTAVTGGGELQAWSVGAVKAVPPARAPAVGTPLVGRELEMALLRRSFGEAVEERQCRVVTLVGEPGVGKTRLATEFASSLTGVTVLQGRCLSYGDGITFWPVGEVVRSTIGVGEGEAREVVHQRLADVLPEAPDLVNRLENMIHGETGGTAQELFLATRRLLESVAATEPVVVIFDDVHWGEPTFLDLVEYLASWTQAPLLLIAAARPEVLEVRPHWALAPRMTTVNIAPLSRNESTQLVTAVLGENAVAPSLTERVTKAAGGNPLYLEQMLQMFSEQGSLARRGGSWSLAAETAADAVPPSVHAVIAARLDRLGDALQALLQRAAVVGVEFSGEAVAALASERGAEQVPDLTELLRKEFIVAQPSADGAADAYRFRHGLVRDVAYSSMSKRVRAALHARFAAWLEVRLGDHRGEVDEIIGRHLADATQLRRDLGLDDETTLQLGQRAVVLLAGAGRRALSRSDLPAAAKLLKRGLAVARDERATGTEMALDLCDCLRDMGELSAAAALLPTIVEDARTLGDSRLEARATVAQALLDTHIGEGVDANEVVEAVHGALDVLVAAGDFLGCAQAYQVLADVHWNDSSFAAAQKDLEAALEYATQADAARERGKIVTWLAAALLWGPTHAADAATRCEEILAGSADDRMVVGRILLVVGGLYAMQGRFDEARDAYGRGRRLLEELGMTLPVASGTQISGMIEILAGDFDAAERELRSGYDALSGMGEKGYLPAAAAFLGTALALQGRLEEAQQVADELETLAPDDEIAHADRQAISARVAIHRNACDDAVALAEATVEAYRESDEVKGYADALLLLAEALVCAGRAARAVDQAQEARRLFVSKGIAPSIAAADAIIGRASG